ncbi:hypothetical protein BDA96_07G029900 [Sorghum bicolor]|uniref:Uncharacterized protein n=1 Tax=Sorghum bicolor TaxID=4558 RepID=A0A921U8I0_SORBI|nr:hypothetical protein BDA96_07G029900 [Sorghum bicolor]
MDGGRDGMLEYIHFFGCVCSWRGVNLVFCHSLPSVNWLVSETCTSVGYRGSSYIQSFALRQLGLFCEPIMMELYLLLISTYLSTYLLSNSCVCLCCACLIFHCVIVVSARWCWFIWPVSVNHQRNSVLLC